MSIGLGDNPNTCPARVAKHCDLRALAHDGQMKKRILRDAAPKRRHVVAQFAYLCSGFIDKYESPINDADSATSIKPIVSALRNKRKHIRRG
ncbi:unannotated protein [freshwater metagenome]|uniref:Unannotated protein n=1 Tax=freshwater metagenome TaxID=449393 RepID=A0A6J6WTI7_9ZZZZ